ncbi:MULTISPECIES: type II toxin-antitoxin system Phd/YefM family antitoxin [unclassified Corynebacterium]|nr:MULTISPECIES: type II toxin-antitoxin system Phd/YefM family antitoxin [unclassified Corynebacterium]
MSYTESQANCAQVLDDVVDNGEETIITRASQNQSSLSRSQSMSP